MAQTCAKVGDIEECCETTIESTIYFQKSASTQPITSVPITSEVSVKLKTLGGHSSTAGRERGVG